MKFFFRLSKVSFESLENIEKRLDFPNFQTWTFEHLKNMKNLELQLGFLDFQIEILKIKKK